MGSRFAVILAADAQDTLQSQTQRPVLDRSSFTPAFLGDDSSHVGLDEHGIVDVSG